VLLGFFFKNLRHEQHNIQNILQFYKML